MQTGLLEDIRQFVIESLLPGSGLESIHEKFGPGNREPNLWDIYRPLLIA